MRKPISISFPPRFLIVDPYRHDRVYRKHPTEISSLARKGMIDFCYFPVEPFHYREVKRHATENAVKTCLENHIPISIETRKEVPDWAIDALSRHKFSEIRIQMNTLDKKKWKLLYKDADAPDILLRSFIRCFNGGAYTILKIAPIVPVIIEPFDVFKVVDTVKNWTENVEVCFASFDNRDWELLRERLPKKFEEISKYYEAIDNRYYVKSNYRKTFLMKLKGFTAGLKLKLKVLNEIAMDGDNVTLLDLQSKNLEQSFILDINNRGGKE